MAAPRARRVGVLAVDPTSPYTGGAIMGDRIRMMEHAADRDVFMRSMASRGELGGLAATTWLAAAALDAAGYDPILIETVGAGQSEVEIARLAETTVVVEVPEMGDEVQAIKAGLLEVADIIAVNKGDRPGADRAARQLRAMLSTAGGRVTRTPPPVLLTTATTGEGVAALADAIDAHRSEAAGSPMAPRARGVNQVRRALADLAIGRASAQAARTGRRRWSRRRSAELDPAADRLTRQQIVRSPPVPRRSRRPKRSRAARRTSRPLLRPKIMAPGRSGRTRWPFGNFSRRPLEPRYHLGPKAVSSRIGRRRTVNSAEVMVGAIIGAGRLLSHEPRPGLRHRRRPDGPRHRPGERRGRQAGDAGGPDRRAGREGEGAHRRKPGAAGREGQAGAGRRQADAVLARIGTGAGAVGAAGHDIVIEAVFEDEAVKRETWQALSAAADPEAIFASNTSSISITALATATDRPSRFIGLHFFSPVPVMSLIEIIRGLETDDATLAAARSFAEELGKTVIESKDYPGFIVNRMLGPFINEAIFALMEGTGTAEHIDAGAKLGLNHPMGPLELSDFIGNDVMLNVMDVLYRGFGDPKFRAAPLLRQMVSAGHLGRKTGRGFYRYDERGTKIG